MVEVCPQCMGSMRRQATTTPTSTISSFPTLPLWAVGERSRRLYSHRLLMVSQSSLNMQQLKVNRPVFKGSCLHRYASIARTVSALSI